MTINDPDEVPVDEPAPTTSRIEWVCILSIFAVVAYGIVRLLF